MLCTSFRSAPVTSDGGLPPARLCWLRLQRKSAHFECLADLSLHLCFLHTKENKTWHVFVKTLYPAVHVCSLALSEPLENRACRGRHSSHFTEPQPQNKKSLGAEEERHLPMQLQSAIPLVPWGNENTVSVWAAQRLLLLAGSVLSTNSIQASYSEEWELLLKTSRAGICIVHNDESGIKQPEFQLEVCKSFVVVELTAQNHLWNITPGKPVTTVNNNPARQGLVPAQTDSRNWGAS